MVQEYSKRRNIPYIVQDTTHISLYEEPCTVQYSKSQYGVRDNDFDTAFVSVYAAFVSVVPHNGVDIDSDATNYNDTNADADDTVNSVITTTDNVRDIDPDSVNNNGNCDCDNNKVHPINDADPQYDQNCGRKDDNKVVRTNLLYNHFDCSDGGICIVRDDEFFNHFSATNANAIVDTVVDSTDLASSSNNFNSRIDDNLIPNILSSSTSTSSPSLPSPNKSRSRRQNKKPFDTDDVSI